MTEKIRSISVVGLGLIGGSFALNVKHKFPKIKIYGIDHNLENANKALDLNLIDEIKSMDCKEVLASDLVILAIPVDGIRGILPWLLSKISAHTVVIDTGSTKSRICEAVKDHKNRSQFVSAHPIAGTEYSGPEAAFLNLFKNKKNIICEFELCNDRSKEYAVWIFDLAGLTNIFMDAESHDKHLAYVSHLSHVSSFTLGLTVLNIEKNEDDILNLAGSGFASTVRLAKSSPEMWGAIFKENKHHLHIAIEEYIQQLQYFQKQIETENIGELATLMRRANAIKKVLD